MNVNVNVKKIGRGGKRRALGWTLLALGLLSVGVWVGWWGGSANCGRWQLSCFDGLFVAWRHDNGTGSYTLSLDRVWPSAGGLRWVTPVFVEPRPDVQQNFGLACYYNSKSHVCWAVVVWPIPPLLWTPAALLLRSGTLARRRAVTGSCPACGYDRRGLAPGAVCPECGN